MFFFVVVVVDTKLLTQIKMLYIESAYICLELDKLEKINTYTILIVRTCHRIVSLFDKKVEYEAF